MNKWLSILIVAGVLSSGCTSTAAPGNPSPTVEQPGSSTPVETSPSEPLITPTNIPVSSIVVNTLAPTANSLSPTAEQTQPGGNELNHGKVYLDKVEVLMEGNDPARPMIRLQGSLPTPCDKLQVDVGKPDSENRIQVQVYSEIDPNQMCAQVLVPFTKNVSLENLPAGKYTVWVNGKQAGNIDMP